MAAADLDPTTRRSVLLVVEDDAMTREVLALLLRDAGYEVATVADGRAALDYLVANPPPGLILLDMLLPALDGWSLLEERHRHPDLAAIPLIILTALPIASREWAASLGAEGFLRKPVDIKPLLAEVQRRGRWEPELSTCS